MPAQFESIGTVFVAAAATAVVPKPAGLTVGELMLAVGILNTGGATTITVPSGWAIHDQTEPSIGTPKGFVATKIADSADVAATDFTFGNSNVIAAPWQVGVLRISGVVGFDALSVAVVDNINLANPTLPALLTIKDPAFLVRFTGTDTNANEPTAVSDPPGHTRRGIEGGAEVGTPGPSDAVGIWWTRDSLVSPPQTVPSELLTLTGNTGNTRSVQYTVSIEAVGAAGSGGIMGGPETMRERMDRRVELPKGTRILNPFTNRFGEEDTER